jgi:hypothetical protein
MPSPALRSTREIAPLKAARTAQRAIPTKNSVQMRPQRYKSVLPVFPRVLIQQFQIAHHFKSYRRRYAKSDRIYLGDSVPNRKSD